MDDGKHQMFQIKGLCYYVWPKNNLLVICQCTEDYEARIAFDMLLQIVEKFEQKFSS